MMRSKLPILVVASLAGCVMEMDDDAIPDEEIGETEQAVEQYEYDLGNFTVRLHQNGAYDMPVVLIEGFDPNDDFKAFAYWNYYPNYRGAQMPPLLTAAFRDMLAARGYDLWIVSANSHVAADYISNNGWRYATEVHPYIRSWGGTNRSYVLVGHSAGGLIARYALSYYINRTADIRAYVSFDAPHEGVYVPRSLQMYMLDHAICNVNHLSSNGFTDPLECHTRYITKGLASGAASDMLRIRMYPTCLQGGYNYNGWYNFAWPSFWNDCRDWGGCTLMNDGEFYHCWDFDGGWLHGDFAWYIKRADSLSWLGWFTDIPRYAVSNGGVNLWTGSVATNPAYLLKTDVNNAGDHHLYTDDWDRDCTYWYGSAASECKGFTQVRGSKDGFMDRLNEAQGGGFNDWMLHKKGNFTFVSHDSAFGSNSGLSWSGKLLGQCAGNEFHDVITAGTSEYVVDILNQAYGRAIEFKDPNGDRRPRQCGCGDGYCDNNENAWSCGDCGYCGDYICGPSEGSWNCQQDCGYCGDYVCNPGEDSWSCPSDCGGGGYCGDYYCDWGYEDEWSCPQDCGGYAY